MRSVCVAVPKGEAEGVRRTLLAMGLLRRDAKVDREGDTVFLPVTKSVAVGFPNVEREVREAPRAVSYKELARVPPNLRSLLPTSFDVVGDIAVVRIPDELSHFEADVAEAVRAALSNVEVVAADDGVHGPFRIRRLRVLAGPDRTETEHREFGLSYRVDLSRAYFSPRLGAERMRVASLVEEGEVVVDAFSGVGPFAILIATTREPKVVHAFDANPDAFRYLEENVRRNRAHRVDARLGDGIELLRRTERPHRVVLDFPQGPEPAYRAAIPRVRPGGVVHVYEVLDRAEAEGRERGLVQVAASLGRSVAVTDRREVHGWSAARAQYAFDVRLE